MEGSAAPLGGGRRVRILHVGVGNLGPGGVATYLQSVAGQQRSNGHEVLVAELWPSEAPSELVEALLPDLRDLHALEAQWRPDVVHMHSLVPDWSGFVHPVVVTAHDHSVHCPSGARFLYAKECECRREVGAITCLLGHYRDRCGSRHPASLLRRFRIAAGVLDFPGMWIAPSRYTRGEMLRRGIPESRVALLHNPSTSRSAPRHPDAGSEPTLAYVGRLARNKGCLLLLEVVAAIPGLRCLVLGEGPERASLQQAAAGLGIEDRVRFAGWTDARGVGDVLSRATALVVPSLWPEPFGLVILEAFAHGCPVVAADTGGIRDLVEQGRTGYLFAPGDARSLETAVRRMLDNPAAAKTMGEEARRFAEAGFRVSDHVDALDVIYRAAGAP